MPTFLDSTPGPIAMRTRQNKRQISCCTRLQLDNIVNSLSLDNTFLLVVSADSVISVTEV